MALNSFEMFPLHCPGVLESRALVDLLYKAKLSLTPVKSTLTCSASVDPFLVSCLEYVLALATTISAHRDFCHARELSYY